MKKLLTLAALMGAVSMSFGQGFVAFFNTSGSRFSTNSYLTANTSGGSGAAVAAAAPGSSYYFELLVAPSTTSTIGSSLTGWTDTGVLAANTATAGRLTGQTQTDGGALIPGYAPGSTANFAIVGWSANLGTYQQALAWWNNGNPTTQVGGVDFFGISAVGNSIIVNASGTTYNNVMGPAATGQIQGLVLGAYAVPEPGTIALAGLSAASLLIFRRRK
jgi:hypothetical protein